MPSSDPTARIEAFKKKDKANGQCAVCGSSVTTVLMQHHSFICTRCAGFLRDVGLTVKGITMTNWTAADADKICAGGNKREREELCASWNGKDMAVSRESEDPAIRRFIQAKYVEKRWAKSGGGAGGGTSSTAGQSGGGGSGGADSAEHVKRFASMFPELNEAKAKELVAKHGSVQAAIDAYLDSQPVEPRHRTETPQDGSPVKSGKSSSRRSKSKRASKEAKESKEAPPAASAFFTAPPVVQSTPPPQLGEASPSRVQEMAGMVGMLARREIEMPGQNALGGGAFGQPSAPMGQLPPTGPEPFGAGAGAFGQQQPWVGGEAAAWRGEAPPGSMPPGGFQPQGPGGGQGFGGMQGAEPRANGWQHPPAPAAYAWGQPPPAQGPAAAQGASAVLPSPRNPFAGPQGGPPPSSCGSACGSAASPEQRLRLQQLEQRKQQLLLELQQRKEQLMQQMQQQQQMQPQFSQQQQMQPQFSQQQHMQHLQPFNTTGGSGPTWAQAAPGHGPAGFGPPGTMVNAPVGQGAPNPFW